MPMYEMQDTESQAIEEIYFPMADAPEIGSVRVIGGREMRRIIQADGFQTSAKPTLCIEGALSLPRATRSAQGWKPPSDEPWHSPKQQYDHKGRPVFTTVAQKDDFLARSNGKYGYGID